MQKNRPAPLGMTVGRWRWGTTVGARSCERGNTLQPESSFAEVLEAEVAELDCYAGFGAEAFG
jgi:hypothetical protein